MRTNDNTIRISSMVAIEQLETLEFYLTTCLSSSLGSELLKFKNLDRFQS